MSDNHNLSPAAPRRSGAEWVTFFISLAIVACIVGLVLHSWRSGSDDPPLLTITSSTSKIKVFEGQYYIPFQITNSGGETAESIGISAEIGSDGEVKESGTREIDFLAPNEREEGAFIFTLDPRRHDFNLRVTGYKLP